MDFKKSSDRIWLEDAQGKEIAFVSFPAKSEQTVEIDHTVVDGSLRGQGVAGALLVFSIAFEALTGKVGLGGGDLKLVFMAGLYLGLAASVLNLLLSCVLGLVFNLAWARAHPQGDPHAPAPRAFPFGPAISASVWLTLLFGSPVLAAYLGLFL